MRVSKTGLVENVTFFAWRCLAIFRGAIIFLRLEFFAKS